MLKMGELLSDGGYQNMTSNGYIEHPVQAIMSRTGSFPLRVVYDILNDWSNPSAIVLDPFCGKGTSLLAARLLGFSAYGMDVAPEAVACTAAKLANVSLDSVLEFIDDLELSDRDTVTVPHEVNSFFHTSTLSQIVSLKKILIKDMGNSYNHNNDETTFVLAAMLGILHGHASFSLSVPSAHAYSMAPAYVERFARQNGLEKPKRNVKTCLATKASRCLKIALPKPVKSGVKRASVFKCAETFPELVGNVDIIVTSPPYLNAQTYAKDNWLRHWFLGSDYRSVQHEYLATNSVSKYSGLMEMALSSCIPMLKKGGKFICIAGDVAVKSRKNGEIFSTVFETGTFLEDLCKSTSFGLKVLFSTTHTVASHSRYFHALSKSNGHTQSNLVERVFVAEKL